MNPFTPLSPFVRIAPAGQTASTNSDPIAAATTTPPPPVNPVTGEGPFSPIVTGITLVSGALSAYHGYKRNDSLGWGVFWGACGLTFPIITPVIAFAQGYGKPASEEIAIAEKKEAAAAEKKEASVTDITDRPARTRKKKKATKTEE